MNTNKLFLGQCDFVAGVATMEQMPVFEHRLPEVAFAGRSNVGKSSLINALTNRKALARTSSMPGRTSQLNFFLLAESFYLVDMPGYGFARISKTERAEWDELIVSYLKGRPTLRAVLLLVDARHGLKDTDREILKLLNKTGVSIRVILTKCDAVSAKGLKEVTEATEAEIGQFAAVFPSVYPVSSQKAQGIEELRQLIAELTNLNSA
ncbi:MAG: YihA family ribosome biogenesis GTP-binding protein [Alphaproteobacteria bacterium]|nr:YihA family ribosome biogenesis GTP-binding protein [Alphaproteobacteria bacterium]